MEAMIYVPSLMWSRIDNLAESLRQIIASFVPGQSDETFGNKSDTAGSAMLILEASGSGCCFADETEQLQALSSAELMMMASDPTTPAQTLARLARSKDQALVERVAENRNADRQTLAALACHPAKEVRKAVADNWRTPYRTLTALAQDECADVRYRLAEDHNLPSELLEFLAQDENPYVRWRAQTTLDRINSRPAHQPAYTV